MSASLSDRSIPSANKFGRLSEIMNQYSDYSNISLGLEKGDLAIRVNIQDQTKIKTNKPSTVIKRKNPAPFFKLKDARMSVLMESDMKESIIVSKQIQLQNGRNLTVQMFRQKDQNQQINIKQVFKKKTNVNQNQLEQSIAIIKRQPVPSSENKSEKINCFNATVDKCQNNIKYTKNKDELQKINIQTITISQNPVNKQINNQVNLDQSVNSSINGNQQRQINLCEDIELEWRKPLTNQYNSNLENKSQFFSSFGFDSQSKGQIPEYLYELDQIINTK